eukprot:11632468-Alexandrium_andersonii.AAC.1
MTTEPLGKAVVTSMVRIWIAPPGSRISVGPELRRPADEGGERKSGECINKKRGVAPSTTWRSCDTRSRRRAEA